MQDLEGVRPDQIVVDSVAIALSAGLGPTGSQLLKSGIENEDE